MWMKSLLQRLKVGVTEVTEVTPLIYKENFCNPSEKPGVTEVTKINEPAVADNFSEDVTAFVTPVTPAKNLGLQKKVNEINAVTPVTPVTPKNNQCLAKNGLLRAIDGAPAAVTPVTLADPDRWCWPHSPAMNTHELAVMAHRLADGMSEAEADNLTLLERQAQQAAIELLAGFSGRKPPPDNRRWDTAPIPQINPQVKTLNLSKRNVINVTSQAWIAREAAHKEYMKHHWTCLVCIASGQGRGDKCSTGAALWATHLEYRND